jgi:hypothetical protein
MTKKFVTGISTQGAVTIQGPNSPINLPIGGNGTSGQILTSTGTGTTPIWADATGFSSQPQQLFFASPVSGSGNPSFRYISTSDFTQYANPIAGQALIAAPVAGGWAWSTVITNNGGSITGTLGLSGTSSQLTLNSSTGTSGQVLTSAGAGNTPTWRDIGYTLISSVAFTSAPSFTSIPQTYKKLVTVIVFTNVGTMASQLGTTFNGSGSGYSYFRPAVSTSFTSNSGTGVTPVTTTGSVSPVVGNSYLVEIPNYTYPNSRAFGYGDVVSWSGPIPSAVSSLTWTAVGLWGGATGTAYLYGVN